MPCRSRANASNFARLFKVQARRRHNFGGDRTPKPSRIPEIRCVCPGVTTDPRSHSPPGAGTQDDPGRHHPGLILALGLGQDKSGACASDPAAQARCETVATRRLELLRLFDRHRPALVTIDREDRSKRVPTILVPKGIRTRELPSTSTLAESAGERVVPICAALGELSDRLRAYRTDGFTRN